MITQSAYDRADEGRGCRVGMRDPLVLCRSAVRSFDLAREGCDTPKRRFGDAMISLGVSRRAIRRSQATARIAVALLPIRSEGDRMAFRRAPLHIPSDRSPHCSCPPTSASNMEHACSVPLASAALMASLSGMLNGDVALAEAGQAC